MKAFYLAGASFLMISTSYAATVKVAEGTVLLQDGHGNFKSVVFGTTSVNPGDKIVIRSGGVAVVDYGNACTVRLPAGIWTIKPVAPCKDSAAIIDFTSRMNQAGPPEGGDLPIEETASAPAANMTPWIIGGLAVAGGVGIAIAVSNSGDNDDPMPAVTPTPRDMPASP